jgi:hypothetical protein
LPRVRSASVHLSTGRLPAGCPTIPRPSRPAGGLTKGTPGQFPLGRRGAEKLPGRLANLAIQAQPRDRGNLRVAAHAHPEVIGSVSARRRPT